MKAYRICQTRYIDTAFEGTGSARAGGRWNAIGQAVVYLAEHRGTAALELMVHTPKSALKTMRFSIFEVDIPDDLIAVVDVVTWPIGWDSIPETNASIRIGSEWYEARETLALKVPSVIVHHESNVLLNPAHPDFAQVRIEPPEPFVFDDRLSR
ncbi:RES family NAD+ phosphorylase [Candidatus Entotheonella palauensis]|uniref:RES domain-containing protein n=1 Tax=Candidatus Entotheonella gemina TaxID=1429439 RepID=W4MBW0_9BACT|nr:RES family NAD+ phosphorylase [Candidatus Entotheonella palauensis]ETX07814.1 MAG: hypothetical protein ETSY2_09010 [Candidatus Entotheonella gemina]